MEDTELQNSVTITGKKKSADKQTEISYSYKVYFSSTNRDKAFADMTLAEELVSDRRKNTTVDVKDNKPSSPRGAEAI